MTTRKIPFSIGEYYHLYSRGVDKRLIFLDENDKDRFIRLLYLCNSKISVDYRLTKDKTLSKIDTNGKLVAIGAYCLMPNHFHILVKEIEGGGIVKFMSKLMTAYSKYFNLRHGRTGALFSSEFKGSHVDNDEYLRYLYAYIHLNPLKIIDSKWRERGSDPELLKSFISRYQYSSYLDYVGISRDEALILNKQVFPSYFDGSGDFVEQMQDWLSTDLYEREGSV